MYPEATPEAQICMLITKKVAPLIIFYGLKISFCHSGYLSIPVPWLLGSSLTGEFGLLVVSRALFGSVLFYLYWQGFI